MAQHQHTLHPGGRLLPRSSLHPCILAHMRPAPMFCYLLGVHTKVLLSLSLKPEAWYQGGYHGTSPLKKHRVMEGIMEGMCAGSLCDHSPDSLPS